METPQRKMVNLRMEVYAELKEVARAMGENFDSPADTILRLITDWKENHRAPE